MKVFELFCLFVVYLPYPILSGLKDGVTFATSSRPYHRLGFILRACIISAAVVYKPEYAFYVPVYSVYFWIVFDLSWNWTAHKPLLYVGHTAELDKFFAAKIYAAKAGALLAGIIVLLFKYKIL